MTEPKDNSRSHLKIEVVRSDKAHVARAAQSDMQGYAPRLISVQDRF